MLDLDDLQNLGVNATYFSIGYFSNIFSGEIVISR